MLIVFISYVIITVLFSILICVNTFFEFGSNRERVLFSFNLNFALTLLTLLFICFLLYKLFNVTLVS